MSQLERDIASYPSVFYKEGSVPRSVVAKTIASLPVRIPDELNRVWVNFGGIEMFESEQILSPNPTSPDFILDVNSIAPHSETEVIFAVGVFQAAIQADGTIRMIGEETDAGSAVLFASLDAWYAAVRSYFQTDYGLPPAPPGTPSANGLSHADEL